MTLKPGDRRQALLDMPEPAAALTAVFAVCRRLCSVIQVPSVRSGRADSAAHSA